MLNAGELNNTWGSLRRTGDYVEYSLTHRTKDGRRDTYNIGRSRSCDITVEDKRVSSSHCLIYCDYTQVRLRVFIEDSSANGTFINDSLTRISKGERLELKSGDQIYLINPRNMHTNVDKMAEFTFINIRERLVGQRVVAPAPTVAISVQADAISAQNYCKGEVISSIEKQTSGSSLVTDRGHIEEHYIIGDQIGSGMSGQVYFCLHRATNAQCAVKVIDTRKFVLTPGLSVSDLMEEAAIVQQLDHPNIIKVLNTFQTEHGIHIVMELLKGGDLFDRIVEKGRYSEAAARKIMRKILSAVSYLHSHNIIHRDLKPENILLVSAHDDTEIKLTDFGLAKKADQEGLKTFCGTPQYFAPEVLKRKSTVKGAGRYGPAADMWSLGVVLYILLSGTFPFDEDNLFDQIQRANYNMNGSEWAGISVGAKHLVGALLMLRPDKRLTVTQALKHPWIQNITYNAAAFEDETKRNELYSGTAGRSNAPAATQQVMNSQSPAPPSSHKRRKSVKNVVNTFLGSELQMSLAQSKPHISTLPLFMTNKKPSLTAVSTALPVFTTSSATSGMLDVYAELTGSQSVVPSALVAAVSASTELPVASFKLTSPVSHNKKQVQSTPLSASPQVEHDLLSGDEIEDCSSGEDNEGKMTIVEEKHKNKKTKSNMSAKRDKTCSKRKRPDNKKAVGVEDDHLLTSKPVVVLEPVETARSPDIRSQSVSLKKQRSLEDSWKMSVPVGPQINNVSLVNAGLVSVVSSSGFLDNGLAVEALDQEKTPKVIEGKALNRTNSTASDKKSVTLLRAPIKSIAQLFKTVSTPK